MEEKKIILYKQIKNIISKMRGKKVLVGGCFDLLHLGHIRFLKEAKKQGDVLIVALEGDEFIQKRKKRRPFHSQTQRAEILASLEAVDFIVLLPYFSSNKEYFLLIKKISPQIIAVTENDPLLEIKKRQGKTVGAQLKILPLIPGFSSSGLILKIKK